LRNIIKNAVVGEKKLEKSCEDLNRLLGVLTALFRSKVDELRKWLNSNKVLSPPEWFESTIAQGCCWLNTSLTFTDTDQSVLKRHLTFWKPIVDSILQTIIEAKRKVLKEGGKTGLVVILWGGS